MFEWLLAPCDPTRVHEVGTHLSWHARSMVMAWSVLVPIGVIAARFFKIFPGQDWPRVLDDRRWWHLHRGAQYASLVLMLVGLFLILSAPEATQSITAAIWAHQLTGWIVLVLGGMQYLSGWFRGTKGGPSSPAANGSWRGDHYDMTRRRRLFERVHKSLGYVAMPFSMAAVSTGLWQANAPRWMLLLIGTWYVIVMVSFAVLQRRGMAYDTYQAIWGLDPQHPGNSLRPIGVGIRKLPPEDE
ncbi:cytochrome b561 domain-containing protein [Rhizobium mesoamericanum]|uniref:cytochrome b561 domain-containing protein n=1 Tax=Rhizobium mesoamericanum TaxID=1079800 RepID=UPI0004915EFE|nr:cytochrome b561 domain-containing protein [Rhizobium mesoamericanum]